MNCYERLVSVLRLEKTDRVPAASPLQTGTIALMEATGAYWPDALYDPEKMARLAAGAYEIAGIESVRVPFCVTTEAEAMGSKIGKAKKDRQPMVLIDEPAIKTPEDVDKLEVPDPKKAARMPVALKASEILVKTYKGRVPVIYGICAPWFVAYQLRGLEKILLDLVYTPDLPLKILDKTLKADEEYVKAILDLGVDVITLIDAGGSGDILGLEGYMKHVYPYEKKLAELIRSFGAYSILHICSDTSLTLDKMADTGVNGISVDQCMDLSWCRGITDKRAALVGNVSPTTTLRSGKPEDVEREAKKCIEKGTNVLAPGCGFSPLTPLDNMRALVKAAKTYY
ncbi:MAG: MtaA/CmuA family methyltransferase [Candidatus Bathyarchaeia archaeon]